MRPRGDEAERDRQPVLITGGAGFVATNLANALASDSVPVLIVDDLIRPGVGANAAWLRASHGDRIEIIVRDVTEPGALHEPLARASRVVHLAAQVAVNSSLRDPGQRYEPTDDALRASGVAEDAPLDFRSPYGCSKGAADQYVLEYARSYGLPAVVFRMSCIYGPRQWGTEDQGWIAHFVRQALAQREITVYGDGKQVRDLLYVDDLVRALRAASEHAEELAGRAFNIGGGPERSASLLEILDLIRDQGDGPARVRFEPWRSGDQRYYVSDTRAFGAATGWEPQVGVRDGREHDYGHEHGIDRGHGCERSGRYRPRSPPCRRACRRAAGPRTGAGARAPGGKRRLRLERPGLGGAALVRVPPRARRARARGLGGGRRRRRGRDLRRGGGAGGGAELPRPRDARPGGRGRRGGPAPGAGWRTVPR